ncbi:DUF6998 domain-containing protein [Ruegeria atlantica]|uniref:DUF6998 domain-containing protein n=1 Tax=Ruegeria atlantica TaxID=81569 RepID=UPI0024957796|nr:hypothetical protein [Ruegeria atlantica]
MDYYYLPSSIKELVDARNRVEEHYSERLKMAGSEVFLKFTLDGNLVGDIGEAIAVDLFGIRLDGSRAAEGIDGIAPDGRTVQVKATGTGRGPAFRSTRIRAEHLLFFDLDFKNCRMSVVFNGPEHIALKYLPENFPGQRMLTAKQIRSADTEVEGKDRLPLTGTPACCSI